MKSKKGFTLVELIIIIMLICVIFLIAVPAGIKILDKTKINTYKQMVLSYEHAASTYYARALKEGISFDENVNIAGDLVMDGKLPEASRVYINSEGKIKVFLKYEKMCFYKDFTDTEATSTTDLKFCGFDNLHYMAKYPVDIVDSGNGLYIDVDGVWRYKSDYTAAEAVALPPISGSLEDNSPNDIMVEGYPSSSVSNYIYFNCFDTKDLSTCEKWRIISYANDSLRIISPDINEVEFNPNDRIINEPRLYNSNTKPTIKPIGSLSNNNSNRYYEPYFSSNGIGLYENGYCGDVSNSYESDSNIQKVVAYSPDNGPYGSCDGLYEIMDRLYGSYYYKNYDYEFFKVSLYEGYKGYLTWKAYDYLNESRFEYTYLGRSSNKYYVKRIESDYYRAGFLSYTEYMSASNNSSCLTGFEYDLTNNNNISPCNNWLNDGSNYWIGVGYGSEAPVSLKPMVTSSNPRMFAVFMTGNIIGIYDSYSYIQGARIVVELNSSNEIVSGSGTVNSPYVLKYTTQEIPNIYSQMEDKR